MPPSLTPDPLNPRLLYTVNGRLFRANPIPAQTFVHVAGVTPCPGCLLLDGVVRTHP